ERTNRIQHRVEADPALIERARTDRTAFGELYDLYLHRVYAFCWSYSATKEQAEDLTAHTFERALVAIGRYEDRGVPFSSWLLRIAANLARDRAARVGKEVPSSGEDDDLLERSAEGAAEPSPETVVERWERAAWLRTHLATLSADQQRVIQLRFWEDRSWSDVAGLLNRSEDAAKQLLRRTLKALAAKIGEEGSNG
ncbi:MAG TPA: RNA polymerase sigma factor, partial [Chloroflexota bacterium]|nr:RNA polymerase sigma factor [Chloroflexota bacterium]